jgi:phosphoserine phosphatase RsbX
MESTVSAVFDWGVASLPLQGQTQSGDCHVVKIFSDEALVAVVDGLGHGRQAAAAARLAADVMDEYVPSDSLTVLFERCHERLRDSRGAVISLALLDAAQGAITWLGVGNIEGLLFRNPAHDGSARRRPQESLLLRPGVVGRRLPRLSNSTLPLQDGDLLVFATDGIGPAFAEMDYRSEPALQIAHHILSHYRLMTDDALALAVRYIHERPSRPCR